MRQRLKSVLPNALLFLGILAVLDVGLAQVGKRLVDTWELRAPERLYRIPSSLYHHDLAANASVLATWGGIRYPVRTNSLGFRDARVRAVPRDDAAWRLVFTGDSFTEGVGVPFEATFVGRVARALAPRGVEVLNAAAVSYAPVIYYRKVRHLLEEEGISLDALVVFVDVSDVQDEAQFYRLTADGRVVDREPPKALSATARALRFVRLNSLGVNVLSRVLILLDRRLHEGARERLGVDAEEAAWTYDPEAYAAWGAEGLRLAGRHMDLLLELLRRHGVAMELVVYPWPDQILRRDLESRQVTFWREWADRNGVPFLNLFPLFVDSRDPEETIRRYFIPYDFHWNAAGHALVARALLDGGLTPGVLGPAGRPGAFAEGR